jgi:sugar phosphate permease
MIIGQYGWRAAAFVLLFTVLVVIVPLLLVLRNKPEELGLRPDGDAASPQSSTFAKTAVNDEDDSSVGLKQALHTRTFWLLSSIFAIQLFVSFGIFTHIMPHLSNIGIDRQLSSFIAAGIPVISIIEELRLACSAINSIKRKR